MAEGDHLGMNWGEGDCYKCLEGLSHLYRYEPDEEILAEVREKVEWVWVRRAQDKDGYINSQVQIPGGERWNIRVHHEDFNLGHLFTAAVVNYQATGDRVFIDVAVRVADNLYDYFAVRRRHAGQFSWNPVHIAGLDVH